MPGPEPELKLRLVVDGGDWLGPGKADLLEAIADTGSILSGAKRMGMSYKRAWVLVDVLNGMFREPLVVTSRGGAGHGGAELTATGNEVLRLYRRMQERGREALGREIAALAELAVIPEGK